MAHSNAIARGLVGLLLLLGVASALKFDVQAHSGRENHKKERCIRNWVAKDTLVVVTATVGGFKGDGMQLNIQVPPPPHHSPATNTGLRGAGERENRRMTDMGVGPGE